MVLSANFAWFNRLRKTHLSFVVGALLCIAIFLTYWISTLKIPYVGQDFLYSADLQTKISVYSDAQNRFEGDTYNTSNYSIQPVGSSGNITKLQSIWRTTSLDNTSVETIRENSTVNNKLGNRTDLAPVSGKQAYLFAPRGASKDTSFIYQPIGTKMPAVMNYEGQEKIQNLTVYRYHASFIHPLIKDGTIERPQLRVWIEPTTGWMIKFQQNSTKYRYDAATKTEAHPIESTASTFTDASIRQNIEYAKQLRYCLEFGRQVAPGVLTFCILLALLVSFIKGMRVKSLSVQATIIAIFAVACSNMIGWIFHIEPLIQMFIGSASIGPLAAFCFICVGIALIALQRRKSRYICAALGSAIFLIALLSAANTSGLTSLDLGNTLFRSIYDPSYGVPNNLSLFGDIAFCILGAAIVKAGLAPHRSALKLANILAGIAVALGLAGLLAKILLLDQVFVVPFVASLSPVGSLLCLLSGIGLMEVLSYHHAPPHKTTTAASLITALAQPVALAIPLIAIGVVAQIQQIKITSKSQSSFMTQVNRTQQSINNAVTTYTNAVTGAHALYMSSYSVERSEWQSYISALQISKQYPGMQGVGYIGDYTATEITKLTKQIREQGYPNFALYPAGNRDSYTALIYMEPSTSMANQKLLGYDMSTDPTRNAALIRSAESGTAVMSGKLRLLPETSSPYRGFALFIPVYQNQLPITTIAQREKALEGYVYAPIRATTFFDEALRNKDAGIQVSIFDGFSTENEDLLYGEAIPSQEDSPTKFREKHTLYANGRPWTVVYTADRNFAASNSDVRLPSIIMVGGSICYVLGIIGFYWIAPLVSRGKRR